MLKTAECLMSGDGVPADPELALTILILLADDGSVDAQDVLRSMTAYDLAECDGEDLRKSEAVEGPWGRETLERIDARV